LEFSLFGLCATLAVLIAGSTRRSWPAGSDPLFRAVQDISIEGVAVYRVVVDRSGEVVDFEYRYANPAARAIMKGKPGDVAGERLLKRLPEARNHPQLFPRYVRVFRSGEVSEAEYELGGRWFHSTVARLDDGVVATVQDISGRRRAEDVQTLLLQELSHRVKNLFASVIAMVSHTERRAATAGEFRENLLARLHALSRAHSLLGARAWTDAAVGDVVRSTLEPHLDLAAPRFEIEGPELRISSDVALALNMALHELATNAAKYGALSTQEGQVAIHWAEAAERPGFVRLKWTEFGGSEVSAPASPGFGSRLLERAFAASGGDTRLEYDQTGIRCEMVFPDIHGSGAPASASPGPATEGIARK
jgi:two-component sensor histidine kinase